MEESRKQQQQQQQEEHNISPNTEKRIIDLESLDYQLGLTRLLNNPCPSWRTAINNRIYIEIFAQS